MPWVVASIVRVPMFPRHDSRGWGWLTYTARTHSTPWRNRMRMLVLGAGLQGSACAFDLLQNPDVREVRLADLNVEHLPSFLAPYSGPRLIPTRLDVRAREAVLALM